MFQLPSLPYSYDALEPHFDAKTMEIHHTKHHQGYTDKLNAAIEGTDLAGKSIEEILAKPNLPQAVINNGGGFYNHRLFWTLLSPEGGGEPQGDLAEAITSAFSSFDAFKEEFETAAKTRFGSGWAWLVLDNGELKVTSTANQDCPVMDGQTPILGLDVWEHAYYLHYQNRRPDYVSAFWNVVNWNQVQEYYNQAQ
jgi:Fe-Mn family superoxide dismutase